MKTGLRWLVGIAATAVIAFGPGLVASTRDAAGTPVPLVITVQPASGAAEPLLPSSLAFLVDGKPAPVLSLERFAGGLAGIQLAVALDDSSGSSDLTVHFSELRPFLETLPATTEVAVGYMRNGSVRMEQPFTLDHQAAADSLRVPLSAPGLNGSPYFALSDLIEHWPSEQPAPRRAVLMLTDGVDRYFGNSMVDDPYVDRAILDAAKHGVTVYSIYLRGAGFYGSNGWAVNMAQSRLLEVADQTGGNAYFQDFSNPVSVTPFLSDLQDRLANQYRVTIAATGKGLREVKLHTAAPGLKITAPTRVYVP